MIFWFFVLGLFATIFCFIKKTSWKISDEKSLQYFFYNRSFEFFITFTLVTAFYSILWLMVEETTNKTTLAELESLEHFLENIEKFIGFFKLQTWQTIIFLLLLFGLNFFELFTKKAGRVYKFYKEFYKPWYRRIYIAVVLLCSFTFFGTQLGEPVAHLRVRREKIETGYSKLHEEAKDRLTVAVQQNIYDRAKKTLPPKITDSLDYIPTENETVKDLKTTYTAAKMDGVKNVKAERLLKDYANVGESYSYTDAKISYDATQLGARHETVAVKPPPETTEAVVENSLKTLNLENDFNHAALMSTPRSRFVSILKLESSKELLCRFPKSFVNAAKSAIFAGATEKYPILEPIVDLLVETFDKKVEQKVDSSVDKITDSLLKNPENAEGVINAEATEIANSVEIAKTPIQPNVLQKITSWISKMKSRLTEINSAEKQIEEQETLVEEKRQHDEEKAVFDSDVVTSPSSIGYHCEYESIDNSPYFLTKCTPDCTCCPKTNTDPLPAGCSSGKVKKSALDDVTDKLFNSRRNVH